MGKHDIAIDCFESIQGKSLSEIEEIFISAGLDKNSFCVYKNVFSDNSECIMFNPPTDFDENKARQFLMTIR